METWQAGNQHKTILRPYDNIFISSRHLRTSMFNFLSERESACVFETNRGEKREKERGRERIERKRERERERERALCLKNK